MKSAFADIVIPLSVYGTYTYRIPKHLRGSVSRGTRVTVPFGPQRSYTGMVVKVHGTSPPGLEPREITGVAEPAWMTSERHLDFLLWLSEYYLALPGEVIKAAFPPAGVKSRRVRASVTEKPVSGSQNAGLQPPASLTEEQAEACGRIRSLFNDHEVVLLHGVTSSGKTEIYIHLIQEQLGIGKQVLYMLPEIALTTQIIARLKKHFGDAVGVYHSRLSAGARREVWERVGNPDHEARLNLVLGVRSSLFLPFCDLGLVIVDEEHDTSYKQVDPSPRYHARDAAIMLARTQGAKTLLGSATPSLESYHNAMTGRFGLAELLKRYGEVMMPSIILADTRSHLKGRSSPRQFSPLMLEAVEDALSKGEQVILFQNRRGFSPFLMCSDCGWVPRCTHCSVSYTYHKSAGKMKCHYCGKSEHLPHSCGKCGSTTLVTMGFGTEKIEEEIRILFPSSSVSRMDQDTTRGRHSHSKILADFARGATDILIGTQMISKGLDFENLTVVGILDADAMMHFSDFRAFERSFQLMEQVSGRAGRRTKRGKVIIQTADPAHEILRQVLKHDFRAMYEAQMAERELFGYPPFTRLIKLTVRHRNLEQLNLAASSLAAELRKRIGKHVLGPEFPPVMQVQKWYIKTILVKLGKELSPSKAKDIVRAAIGKELKSATAGRLRIHADVDPL